MGHGKCNEITLLGGIIEIQFNDILSNLLWINFSLKSVFSHGFLFSLNLRDIYIYSLKLIAVKMI